MIAATLALLLVGLRLVTLLISVRVIRLRAESGGNEVIAV